MIRKLFFHLKQLMIDLYNDFEYLTRKATKRCALVQSIITNPLTCISFFRPLWPSIHQSKKNVKKLLNSIKEQIKLIFLFLFKKKISDLFIMTMSLKIFQGLATLLWMMTIIVIIIDYNSRISWIFRCPYFGYQNITMS